MTDEQLYGHTLRWVNDQRMRLRLDPLDDLRPGALSSPTRCPIAESLDRMVFATYRVVRHGHVELATPEPVAEFMRRFDGGGFPELFVYAKHRQRWPSIQYPHEPAREPVPA